MRARHSILLVDDEKDHCLNLLDILGDEDYAVDIAHDGPAALELIAGKDYDATLLDLVMPGINGLALLRDIRGRRPDLPACFITANSHGPLADEIRRTHAGPIFAKPLNVPMLIAWLAETFPAPRRAEPRPL